MSETPRLQCRRKGCTAPATCELGIRIPAKGHAIGTHDPITADVRELYLCAECFKTVKPLDFLSDAIRQGISLACQLNGLCPPDFKRAFKVKNPL